MEYTSRLNLKKPQRGVNADPLDINDLDENFDTLDEYAFADKVVDEFPTPTAELVGKRYIRKSDRADRYCVKVKNGSFSFETLTYLEGLEADLPETGVYHTTDTDKWFRDGAEINVDTSKTELPSPSESTLGKYYLVDETLSIGKEEDEMYAWLSMQLRPEIREEERAIGDMEEGIIYAVMSEAE